MRHINDSSDAPRVETLVSSCGIGPCPGVHRTETGDYLVVGYALSPADVAHLLPGKVASNEAAVRVPAEIVHELLAVMHKTSS